MGRDVSMRVGSLLRVKEGGDGSSIGWVAGVEGDADGRAIVEADPGVGGTGDAGAALAE
jgi:hypothetical protein